MNPLSQSLGRNLSKLVLFWTFILLLPAIGEAKTVSLACSATKTIQKVLSKLKPGDVLLVSGTCNENVVIQEQVNNVTVDGQGTATIVAADSTDPTILVRGAGITIQNFASISGGTSGIDITRGGAARVVNSVIENNTSCGIRVTEGSSARIGFLRADDTTASPNTIQNNEDGICVLRHSSARIVGNTIQNNTDSGVSVTRVSHADISSNVIDNNGDDGISVGENSGVNLGRDTGTGIFEAENTTTVNNGDFGIACFINSSANGRLGTLNGVSGTTSFTSGCIDSLI